MNSLHGFIRNHTPYILANVLKAGILRLETTSAPPRSARVPIVVDTGFTGGISLPQQVLQRLRLEFLAYEPYILADHRRVEIPTFAGRVDVGGRLYETRFLRGQPLLGMEFMETVFAQLRMDFRGHELLLK